MTVIFASAYRQLSPAERSFVDSAVQELERAAHRAGERVSMVLNKPLPVQVVERSRGMLERPMVTAAITERINELSAAQDLTIQRMVKEMMAVAFSSMGDYMTITAEGPSFDLTRCTPEQLSAIKSIEVEESGHGLGRAHKRKLKVTLHDKLGGMKMLGQYMGMLEPDNPHWRADAAKVATPALPAGATAQEAGDAYAAMIDG